jgi:hypothetical protein
MNGRLLISCAVLMLALSSCGGVAASPLVHDPMGSHSPVPTLPDSQELHPAPRRLCPITTGLGFSCAMRRRIAVAQHYLNSLGLNVGIMLRDRQNGAVWANDHAGTEFAAASTVKLAMAVDLMTREGENQIHLTGSDRELNHEMLHESSDLAADVLWSRYEDSGFVQRAVRYGMPNLSFVSDDAYWGSMYCTPKDLDGLIDFILAKAPVPTRGYLVHELRHVALNQQFGVWGAGRLNRPGNKDGWVYSNQYWIIDSAGFAGPHGRYTLAMMSEIPGADGYEIGANSLTQVAALLFRGHHTGAPPSRPTP